MCITTKINKKITKGIKLYTIMSTLQSAQNRTPKMEHDGHTRDTRQCNRVHINKRIL